MRLSFIIKLVNGELYDPILYVRVMNGKQAVMFDCGYFTSLSDREKLLLDAIFISHMHMDHFSGFDLVLRTILHRDEPLHLFGPQGITGCALSRLQGYTWNLSGDYKLEVVIHEIHDDVITITHARAENGFKKGVCREIPRTGHVIYSGPRFSVSSGILDHNIPCLCYSLQEATHVNIRPEALEENGFVPGGWLTKLKELILENKVEPLEVKTESGVSVYSSGELKDKLAIVARGQKISYITDTRFSQENIDRILEVASDSDALYIEAFYLDELKDEAFERAHLTALQAGEIAKLSRAKKSNLMHISPRYHERSAEIVEEFDMGTGSGSEA